MKLENLIRKSSVQKKIHVENSPQLFDSSILSIFDFSIFQVNLLRGRLFRPCSHCFSAIHHLRESVIGAFIFMIGRCYHHLSQDSCDNYRSWYSLPASSARNVNHKCIGVCPSSHLHFIILQLYLCLFFARNE